MIPSAVSKRRSGTRFLPVALAAVLVALVSVGLFRYVSRSRHRGGDDSGPALAEEKETTAQARTGGRSRRHTEMLPARPPEIVAAEESLQEQQASKTTAVEHRDKSVAELRASGPAAAAMTASAAKVATAWSEKMPTIGVNVQIGKVECYRKGCFMTVVHATDDDVERATQAITRTGEFHGWQSGKMRSGPIPRPDGKVEATWFLFPPEGDKEPLAATLPPDSLDELQGTSAR
jgi:hypothetical protein